VGRIIHGRFDDPAALAALAASVDVVTFDVENVPRDAAAEAGRQGPFLPPPAALGAGQDRLEEKHCSGAGHSRPRPARPWTLPSLRAARIDRPAGDPEDPPAGLRRPRPAATGEHGRPRRRFDALGGVPAILEGFVASSGSSR
jgi:5-(carboxyamino)imidazole ribonucleotide synthase